jgi:D-hydantoinase
MAITDLHDGGRLEDVAKVPDQGVTSYKLFMAYKGAIMVDDETLFRTMQVAADTGALVMVHAENGDVIDVLVKEALEEGKTEPRWHAATRPPLTEGEATSRAIKLAHLAGCPLYVVHVSCEEAIEPVAAARAAGWRIWGETCTQYLFINEHHLEEPDFGGAKYVFTPPPRPPHNHERLWQALGNGVLSAVSSDHCAFRLSDQKTLGRDDFSKIPNGGPGIENRLHMLHHFGVREGRMTMNHLVELCCTAPARLFGLFPRKGTIAVGSDADIVVWDSEKPLTLSASTHHSNVDYNLFEGTEVVGAPAVVLVRGQVGFCRGRGSARSSSRRAAGWRRAPADVVDGGQVPLRPRHRVRGASDLSGLRRCVRKRRPLSGLHSPGRGCPPDAARLRGDQPDRDQASRDRPGLDRVGRAQPSPRRSLRRLALAAPRRSVRQPHHATGDRRSGRHTRAAQADLRGALPGRHRGGASV